MYRAALLSLFLLPLLSSAQSPSPSGPGAQADTRANDTIEQVHLGASVAPLVGPWKFHTGDNPGWAQPGFDDSSWTSLDMTPPADPSDPSETGPVPAGPPAVFPVTPGMRGTGWRSMSMGEKGSFRFECPMSSTMPTRSSLMAFK